MPALSFADFFGNESYSNIDPEEGNYQIVLDLRSFQDVAQGGDIANDLGIKNLDLEILLYQDNAGAGGTIAKFPNLIYALLLLISQNQAAGKNDDPEQGIYVQPAGVSVVTSGNRQGQIERRFTVSFFSDDGVNNLTAINNV